MFLTKLAACRRSRASRPGEDGTVPQGAGACIVSYRDPGEHRTNVLNEGELPQQWTGRKASTVRRLGGKGQRQRLLLDSYSRQ